MTLQEWDETIAPYLQRILADATISRIRAQAAKAGARAIPRVPDFATQARAMLDLAGAELFEAMKAIHDAREAFDGKSKIEEESDAA